MARAVGEEVGVGVGGCWGGRGGGAEVGERGRYIYFITTSMDGIVKSGY